MKSSFAIIIFAVLHLRVDCAPTTSLSRKRRDNGAFVYEYLVKYKFINPLQAGALSDGAMVQPVKNFQATFGLPITGVVDHATEEAMTWPRCGNDDAYDDKQANDRLKRYTLDGSRWAKTALNYFIHNLSGDMDSGTALHEIQRALKVWSDVTPLTFQRVNSNQESDITILFGRGNHGDQNPFDGPGDILAHAYFPRAGGDVHFDDDEFFTANTNRGTNLFQVAAHEFGHSLGLRHSSVRGALMYPAYLGYVPSFQLHSDDIKGIQRIYGASNPNPAPAPVPAPAPAPAPVPTPGSDLCSDGRVDAITGYNNSYIYVFRGQYLYTLTSHGVVNIRRIAETLALVPNNVDAAFYNPYDRTMFIFKGNQVWQLQYSQGHNHLHEGRPISDIFLGLPNDLDQHPLDAAFIWGKNGKIYFTRGTQYYRLCCRNSRGQYRVESDYPRSMTVWGGLPDVDGALLYKNGATYFFRGHQYYRFHDQTLRIASGDPPYPRPIASWWFGCNAALSDISDPIQDIVVHNQKFAALESGRHGSAQTISSNSLFKTFLVSVVMFFFFGGSI